MRIGDRVATIKAPWTRPPMAHFHPSDLRDEPGRRQGIITAIDGDDVTVTWDPVPVWNAGAMTNVWKAKYLQVIEV